MRLTLILAAFGAAASANGQSSPLFSKSPFAPIVHEASLHVSERSEHGNYVGIVDYGYDALLLRVHLIRNAQRSIDIQTFILQWDEAGRLILYELIEAAKRGVRVRLLTDHMFSLKDRETAAFLATVHPNFELKYFRPLGNRLKASRTRAAFSSLFYFKLTNQRMHNKVMVVDDTIAITGGRNIDNHYYNNSLSYNFRDRDALVIGPVVPAMVESFQIYWDFKRAVYGRDLKDVARSISKKSFRRYESRADFAFHDSFPTLDADEGDYDRVRETFVDSLHRHRHVEFLDDLPEKNDATGFISLWGGGRVTQRLHELIVNAEDSLLIQSPYLILGHRTRRMFRKLHSEKPELSVIISTNSYASTDNIPAYSSNYKMRPLYVRKLGFTIYEYKPHPEDLLKHVPNFAVLEKRAAANPRSSKRGPFMSMHAKSFIADDKIAYIGSFNIDPRSFNLNTETGLLIEDEAFALALREHMLRDMAPGNSWVIAKKQRPAKGLNSVFEDVSVILPIDPWPIRSTSSFELRDGMAPVGTCDELFYEHYADIGSFPGSKGWSVKGALTRLYKVVGKPVIPIL